MKHNLRNKITKVQKPTIPFYNPPTTYNHRKTRKLNHDRTAPPQGNTEYTNSNIIKIPQICRHGLELFPLSK